MRTLPAPAARTASAVRADTPPAAQARAAGAIETPIEHYDITWRGIAIRVVYQREATGLPECRYSHLEVMTDRPRRPLPMSETGYQSLFVPTGTIEALGGPLTYVDRWLEHAAKSPQWKKAEREMQQGRLF